MGQRNDKQRSNGASGQEIDEILAVYAQGGAVDPQPDLKAALSGFPSWLPYLSRRAQGGPAPLRKAALRALQRSQTRAGADVVATVATDPRQPSWLRREAAALAAEGIPDAVREGLAALGTKAPIEALAAASDEERLGRVQLLVDDGEWGPLAEALAAPGLADVVLKALVEHETPAAAAFLVELQGAGDAGKAIRKALYALKQKGVVVTEPRREPAAAPTPARREQEALQSHVDGEGAQVIVVTHAAPGDAVVELLQFMVQDEKGLVGFQRTGVNRRNLRAVLADLRRDDGTARVVPMDVSWAWERVRQAFAQSRRHGTEVPEEFVMRRHEWEPAVEGPAESPARAAIAADEIARASASDLASRPELFSWGPAVPELADAAERVEELAESPIVTNPELKQGRVDDEIGKRATAHFDASRRRRYAGWLEDMAVYFLGGGQRDAAAACLRAVEDLAAGPPDGPVPDLLVTFYRRRLEAMREALKARKQEQLVVPPGAP